jgi:hypothetical protein
MRNDMSELKFRETKRKLIVHGTKSMQHHGKAQDNVNERKTTYQYQFNGGAEDTCPTDGKLGAPEELPPVAVDGFGA